MSQVTHVKCPGCRERIRIPIDWIGRSVRCKQCGTTFKAAARSAESTSTTSPPTNVVYGDASGAKPPQPPVRTVTPASQDRPVADDANPFVDFDAPVGAVVPPQRYRRRSTGPGLLLIVIGLVTMTAIGGVIGVAAFNSREKLLKQVLGPPSEVGERSTARVSRHELEVPQPDPDFPRRMLAVCISNYWYANPVSYGDGELSAGALVRRLATVLRIPDAQVCELSDAAAKPHLPLKGVIQDSIAHFLDTSRPQDRIVLLFVGHAVTIDHQPYLVPIEGDLGNKETLIPLPWLYERLAACRARQKVLIADVCRFDPSRGLERPSPGPMSPALDALLRQPPRGVQVWSACSAGQYSYEGSAFGTGRGESRRGLFLSELWEAVGPFRKRLDIPQQKPAAPLPVGPLANGTADKKGVDGATEAAAVEVHTAKQTPYLSGEEQPGGAPFNAAEPAPAPIIVAAPTCAGGPAAPGGLVQSILEETAITASRADKPALAMSLLPPFPLKRMAGFADESAPAPLRDVITRVRDVLQRQDQPLKYDFMARADSAATKKDILEQQHEPARVLARLNETLEELEAAAKEVDRAAPRWRPTYLYLKARLQARIAQVHEYDFMLGQIRMQALPTRDPLKHSGWRLAPDEKLHPASGSKTYAKEARETFKELIKKYPETPWEILARREAVTAFGLEWQLARLN
jgi:predicted Zn finger-like uncharacterized protein